MAKGSESSPPAKNEITRQLEQMLASPDYHATTQQTALLKFIVNLALDGKAREITDETVATEVFGRGPDYDPGTDPIVSIQTEMLRRSIFRYNQTTGKDDPILIDIPPGTCVPTFKTRKLKGS